MQPTTANENATGYDSAWAEGEDVEKLTTPEQKVRAAKDQLALDAMEFVNESIQDRNASQKSQELIRAFKLYNATTVDPNEDLLDDFEGTRTALKEGSKVVQNLVRQVTNDGASQLGDMLYPTDTENYGVVGLYPAEPPLSIKNEQAADKEGNPLTQQDEEGNTVPVTHYQAWKARKVELEAKVSRMWTKIRNNLNRLRFGKMGRELILDAAISGTAVLKGPYVDGSKKQYWARGEKGRYDLVSDEGKQASFKVISVLDFLPEMAAESKDNLAYASVREWFVKRKLRALKRTGRYDNTAIDRLLSFKPRHNGEGTEQGDQERLSIRDVTLVQKMYSERYEVFETWAEFNVGLLRGAGVKVRDESLKDEDTVLACVIHCQGEFLKAYLNPNPRDELPFHVWNWERDDNCILGKGVPILGENCQLIFNAVWRMILDHGGLGAVPMVTIAKDKVEPTGADKTDYSLRGGKVWSLKDDLFNLPDGKGKPFEIHDIPVKLNEFFAIMDKAEEHMYKLTGVTRVEKNDQGVDNAPITLGATAIFQNNSSVARRRQVRDFDDEITESALTMLYDWLMKYEPDHDEFKGPMIIEPRGSSVLMQREVNTQNLMQLYQITGNGTAEGAKQVDMLREIQSGMQFPAGKFIETADETQQRREAEAENPPIDPEVQLRQEELAIKRDEVEGNVEVKYLNVKALEYKVQAEVELKAISDERLHYREMYKTDKLSEVDFNKHMSSLSEKSEEAIAKFQTQMADIQARRDIAAGDQLTKGATGGLTGEAAMVTAEAKLIDAETKRDELDSKKSGAIAEGI